MPVFMLIVFCFSASVIANVEKDASLTAQQRVEKAIVRLANESVPDYSKLNK
jgi:hypothetical protein